MNRERGEREREYVWTDREKNLRENRNREGRMMKRERGGEKGWTKRRVGVGRGKEEATTGGTDKKTRYVRPELMTPRREQSSFIFMRHLNPRMALA